MNRIQTTIALFGVGLTLLAWPASARWAYIPTTVPVDRLEKNVQEYIEKNPKSADGYYTLGRIHSLAFELGKDAIHARISTNGELPAFNPGSVINPRTTQSTPLSGDERRHFLESIRNYRRASELAPDVPVYFLGLGWMEEQGIAFAGQVGAPPNTRGPKNIADSWRELALASYRRAYQLSAEADLRRSYLGPAPDWAISGEAAERIIELLKARPPSEADQAEIAKLRETLSKLKQKPFAVTPIIFSLRKGAALADLLAPGARVDFDLSGMDDHSRWPWLRPDTGILVWDPQQTGNITSGRQLFGSATWWIFWRNGYQALAALDDNHDGWLQGAELNGIDVWFDRNSNGVSDPGEVVTLQSLGIQRIAVQSTSLSGSTNENPHAIQLADGTLLPSFDWTPSSIPPN